MSDVLYPLALTEKLEVNRFTKTVADEFEDGTTMTRRQWSAKYVKRQFTIKHALLNDQEHEVLRSFHAQRDGSYDSFWLRDNVNREGNAKVRFSGPLKSVCAAQAHQVEVACDEVGPTRALVGLDEITAAAGVAPLFWWDACREKYLTHLGTVYRETSAFDASLNGVRPVWAGGSLPLGGTTSQYQWYAPAAAEYGLSLSNAGLAAGTQPACTLFAVVKAGSAPGGLQEIFGVGADAGPLRLVYDTDGYIKAYYSASGPTNCKTNNSPTATWRSFAAAWTASSNQCDFYANAALVATNSAIARSYSAGPARLAGNVAGAAKFSGSLAQMLCFAGTLTLAQVKAVHNLVAHQFSLAEVA